MNKSKYTIYDVDDIRLYPLVVDMDMLDPIVSDIKFKQYDYGTCKMHVQLLKESNPINLTNTSVEIYYSNSLKDVIVDVINTTSDSNIVSPIDGIVEVIVPKDVIMYEGKVSCEILVFDQNRNRITSPEITFEIVKSMSDYEII